MEWHCCWKSEVITPEECPNIGDSELELCTLPGKRFVEKCVDCANFTMDLQHMKEEGHPLASLVPFLITEYLDQKAQLNSMVGFLNTKTREIKFLHELSLVLQTSMDLDEVLSVAMTAITSGKGFGMNRAFLLMTDRDREKLVGYLGVGPRDYEEAWRIWQEIDRNDFSLKSMALHFQKNKLLSEKYKFQDILDRLTVSLGDENHIFNRVLRDKKSLLIENARRDSWACNGVGDILGVDSFLLIPLISKNRRIGVLLADNFVTGKPITLQDMQSLETFAFPVAFGLERASLYERLHEEVDKLTVANIKLHEQQELLVRMERMALVGRITSSIAHSIRNPLMVIGGFARSLLKSIQPDDPKRQFLDSIVSEAKHLENVLEDVLNYSDSQYPVMDEWDLNQLVTEVNNEIRERLGNLGINLILALQSSLPKVRVDYKQFSYSLKTIILNALNLSGNPGEIVLTTRVSADVAVVEIIDRRVWLSPVQIEQLVTPFAATEDLGKGAGLQLCKIILDKHHCDFEISALPEGGTLYAIRIPLNREVAR